MRYGDRKRLKISLVTPDMPKYKKVSLEEKQVGHTFPIEITELLAKDVKPYVLSVWYRSNPEENYAIILGGGRVGWETRFINEPKGSTGERTSSSTGIYMRVDDSRLGEELINVLIDKPTEVIDMLVKHNKFNTSWFINNRNAGLWDDGYLMAKRNKPVKFLVENMQLRKFDEPIMIRNDRLSIGPI